MTAKTPVAAASTTAWRDRITGSGKEAPDQLLANPARQSQGAATRIIVPTRVRVS